MKKAYIRSGVINELYNTEDYPVMPQPEYDGYILPVVVNLEGDNEQVARVGDGYDAVSNRVIPRPDVVWDADTHTFKMVPPARYVEEAT